MPLSRGLTDTIMTIYSPNVVEELKLLRELAGYAREFYIAPKFAARWVVGETLGDLLRQYDQFKQRDNGTLKDVFRATDS